MHITYPIINLIHYFTQIRFTAVQLFIYLLIFYNQMFTHIEAHQFAGELQHLEGKSFFCPLDGLFYEVLSVIPSPCEQGARKRMLEIIDQIADMSSAFNSDELGDYMMTVEGEFDIMALGATEENGQVIFRSATIELIVGKDGFEYEFVT